MTWIVKVGNIHVKIKGCNLSSCTGCLLDVGKVIITIIPIYYNKISPYSLLYRLSWQLTCGLWICCIAWSSCLVHSQSLRFSSLRASCSLWSSLRQLVTSNALSFSLNKNNYYWTEWKVVYICNYLSVISKFQELDLRFQIQKVSLAILWVLDPRLLANPPDP